MKNTVVDVATPELNAALYEVRTAHRAYRQAALNAILHGLRELSDKARYVVFQEGEIRKRHFDEATVFVTISLDDGRSEDNIEHPWLIIQGDSVELDHEFPTDDELKTRAKELGKELVPLVSELYNFAKKYGQFFYFKAWLSGGTWVYEDADE